MTKIDRLLLCSCDTSMTVDEASAQTACGAQTVELVNALCEGDVEQAVQAFGQDGTTLVACGQMSNFFSELFEDVEAPGAMLSVDIRDRAGWSDAPSATAKQAALLADAVLERPATPVRDITSDGTIMVLGGAAALLAGETLGDQLAVTVILTDPAAGEDLEPNDRYDVALGHLKSASGSLAKFQITIDGYAPLKLSGRSAGQFVPPVNGAKSGCDIILDLRGEPALFPAPEKRDGYLRADPGDPLAVQRAISAAAEMQGTFEKPLYIRYDAAICAHSRAKQPGCDRCLNVCPTGAILSAGDHVTIDPGICAGCGACAAVCPSGAASYDDPDVGFIFNRLRSLSQAFQKAGGKAPRVLFHDPTHGTEMIRLAARYGRGLPADLIPFEVANIESVGHAELLAALGVGFTQALVLAGPREDITVPEGELAIAQAINLGTGGHDRQLAVIAPADPDAFCDLIYTDLGPTQIHDTILPLGGRRQVTRLAASAREPDTRTPIALPEGAPYGAVVVNTDACTLCLACISLCPVGALNDNPDKPQLRFQETACLQCGICANTCPENAITLTPQLNLANEALSHQVLHEEEPFECISCNKPFGTKSTIVRIMEKLEGKHWMYSGSDNIKLIQMCDDCRVNAQYHQENSPFFGGDRPKVRTTQDYLDERKKPN